MMKNEIITINKTPNGSIFSYVDSQIIQIEYKNIFLCFHKDDFKNFRNFINNLDIDYMEKVNVNLYNKRKIIIQMKNSKIKIVFNKSEFQEFYELINFKKYYEKKQEFEKFYLDLKIFSDN
ncbi:MAG: hypothetical protein KatS3mg068_0970 [Candidatus Sericytochromatia bacterium]|nr:MAG: hypothetical protein KatS3mg068_0970 [Candidatus Sericytochromatia bacterium]